MSAGDTPRRDDRFGRPNDATPARLADILLMRRSLLVNKRLLLEQALGELRAELSDLHIALNVIGRHLQGQEPEFTGSELANSLAIPDGREVTGAGWRTPSISRMIAAVLADGPLNSREILHAIRRRFVPEIRAGAVTPQASRMARSGRLVKSGRLYSLPGTGEAATGG